MNSSDFNTIT